MAKGMEDKKLLLRMLHKASPKLRRALLVDLPSEIISLLSECALNILKGTVTLKRKQKERLRRHRKTLRILAQDTSIAKKKKALQTGGELKGIENIIPLLPIINSIFAPLFRM